MKHFLQAYYLAPGMARRRLAWQLVRNSSSATRKDKSCAILNKNGCLFLVNLVNPEFLN